MLFTKYLVVRWKKRSKYDSNHNIILRIIIFHKLCCKQNVNISISNNMIFKTWTRAISKTTATLNNVSSILVAESRTLPAVLDLLLKYESEGAMNQRDVIDETFTFIMGVSKNYLILY